MELEILETFRHAGHEYAEGDVRRNIPDELGRYFCAAGWARDTAGQVATGRPAAGEVVLAPEGVVHEQPAEEG